MSSIPVFLLFSFMFVAQLAVSQSKLWMHGNKIIDFNNSSSIQVYNLPTPTVPASQQSLVYGGEIPKLSQYAEYDEDGALLFFICDGKIYDHAGFLMVKNEDGIYDTYPEEILYLQVVKVPTHCDKYFIICKNYNFGSISVFLLDLSLQNQFWLSDNSRKGALINFDSVPLNYSVDLSEFLSSSSQYNFDQHLYQFTELPNSVPDNISAWAGQISMSLYDSGVELEKFLFVAHGLTGALFRVSSEGIFIIDNNVCNSLENDFPRVRDNSPISFLNNSFRILSSHEGANSNFKIGEYTSAMVETNCFYSGAGGVNFSTPIISAERSGNGQFVYFLSPSAPHFRYFDYLNPTLGDQILNSVGTSVNSSGLYNYASLMLNYYQGLPSIFIFRNGGIDVLKGVDNPSTVQFISNVITGLSNPMLDVSDYGDDVTGILGDISFFSATPYHIVQPHSYNKQVEAELDSENCCEFLLENESIGNFTVNSTSSIQTWTYGSNPWNNVTTPVYFNGDLVFNPGSHVDISGMELRFSPSSNVIIHPGASVKLTNGTVLTSYDCPDLMWNGVNLLGQPSLAQSSATGPNTAQGVLVMTNSSIINAICGVEVGTSSVSSGGVLKATTCIFRNNITDVRFQKYHRILNGTYITNKSVFLDCDFITSAHLKNSSAAPYSHVHLIEVDKIPFTNCSFMNTTTISTYPWPSRGMGIYSNRASFIVDGANDSWSGSPIDDNTAFYKLYYGIKTLGYNASISYYTCKEMEFQSCFYGIVNNSTDNVKIYLNNFKVPEAAGYTSSLGTATSMERGIFLDNSTGYIVEQNVFEGLNDPLISDAFPGALGIWVQNSGDQANVIRNNDFHKMLLGIYVTKKNSSIDGSTGLQMLCNNFYNGTYDIYRNANSTIRKYQGDILGVNSFNPAFNVFSQTSPSCSGNGDFVIHPTNEFETKYVCLAVTSQVPDCGGVSNTTFVNLLQVIPVNSSQVHGTCIENFTVGTAHFPLLDEATVSSLLQELESKRLEISNKIAENTQILDKNETLNLMTLLGEQVALESGYYKDILLAKFPLSDEVLQKVIENSSKLGEWDLTQVLLANAPLSSKFLHLLEKNETLSPFFMSFLYEAESGEALRSILEQELSMLKDEENRIINEIFNSSIGFEQIYESDSLQNMVIYQDLILNHVGLANARKQAQERFFSGNSNIDDLINDYEDLTYLDVILSLQDSMERGSAIESDIQELFFIFENGSDVTSSMARALLFNALDSIPEPEPELLNYKNSLLDRRWDKKSENNDLIGIYPNPADNIAYVDYPSEIDGEGKLVVFDTNGRVVFSRELNVKGLLELNTSDFNSGVYLIALEFEGVMLDSENMIVEH